MNKGEEMGYSARIVDYDFVIPSENLDEAYRVMCALNEPFKKANAEKRGSGYWYTPSHFAWMDEDYDEKCKDAEEILSELGFEVYIDCTDSLMIVGWQAEKVGDEGEFLSAIAHLVKPGSFIDWVGEDGDRWRWRFKDGVMATIRPKVVFDE
jgi:hypothetical protein